MDPSLQARLAAIVERLLTETAAGSPPDDALLRRHLLEMRDALDSLRLTLKYLVFDLDATRRENAMLRRQLEERGDPHGGR